MIKDKRKVINLVILIIIILLFFIFIILPLLNEIREGSESFIFEKKRFTELNIKTEKLRNFQDIYQERQININRLNQLLIEPINPINFIKFLEEQADNSQLLREIDPIPRGREEDDYSYLNFRLKLEGSFPNFLKFFERLESGPYLVNILNLNIRRLEEEELAEQISALISIRVYAK